MKKEKMERGGWYWVKVTHKTGLARGAGGRRMGSISGKRRMQLVDFRSGSQGSLALMSYEEITSDIQHPEKGTRKVTRFREVNLGKIIGPADPPPPMQGIVISRNVRDSHPKLKPGIWPPPDNGGTSVPAVVPEPPTPKPLSVHQDVMV